MAVTTVDAGPLQVSRSVDVSAPASELFAIAADPRRHHGARWLGHRRRQRPRTRASRSGLAVRHQDAAVRPAVSDDQHRDRADARSTRRVAPSVRPPLALGVRPRSLATSTRVTETFDFRDAGVKNRLKFYHATGFVKQQRSRHRRDVTSAPRPVHQLSRRCPRETPQSFAAAASSSSHTVASRPTAPAAGTSTGLAPPIAAATASALRGTRDHQPDLPRTLDRRQCQRDSSRRGFGGIRHADHEPLSLLHGGSPRKKRVDVTLRAHAQQVDVEVRRPADHRRRWRPAHARRPAPRRPGRRRIRRRWVTSDARWRPGCRCGRAAPPWPACRCARRRLLARTGRRPSTDGPSTSRSCRRARRPS